MKSHPIKFFLTCVFAIAAGLGLQARADTVTDIAFTYSTTGLYSGHWSNAENGSTIAAAPQNGNTGTGITFADWNSQFSETTPGSTTSYSIDVMMDTSNEVNTLLNTFYGVSGTNATVVFTNSNGDTDTFTLQGGDTIRDYNQNTYQNNLTGGSGDLTAQNWWNNGNGGQRLDVQTFILPAGWDGTELVSMSITAPSGPENPYPDDVLSALQVVTSGTTTPPPPPGPTPEPSSLALLGTGVLSAAGVLRKKLTRK